MNLKSLALSLILFIGSSAWAMNPNPGTVIDPIKHSGQFTVSMAETAAAQIPSGMPSVTQLKNASSDLFKCKGIPVIISTAAGMMPWWALTTGTGYLIITQCGISDPALLTTVAAGAGYGIGEKTTALLKKCINNPYFQNASQLALCAACISLSYMSASNPILSDACFALAQAIGLQAIIEISKHVIKKPTNTQHVEKTEQSAPWISPELTAGMKEGFVNTLNCVVPCLAASKICDPNVLIKILLYEQAYRLAQCGCEAARAIFP